jgi:acetyl esterase/lipase
VKRLLSLVLLVPASTALLSLPASGSPARDLAGPNRSTERFVVLYDQPYSLKPRLRNTFDAYLPVDPPGAHPAIVVIHGGGWRNGSKSDLAPQARYMARRGFATFSIDYRLAPQNPWPAQLEDSAAAVEWIRSHADTYRVDPARIGVFGTSAGGHLASMLATLTDGAYTLGFGVKAAVAWSAPMDLVLLGELSGGGNPHAKSFLGCSGQDQCTLIGEAASPITYVSRNDPPLFFIHSRWESMPVRVAREMNQRMNSVRAPHRYLELPGSKHAAGYSRDEIPNSSTTVIADSVDFFETHL